jgi:hypothetical protein
MTEQVTQRRDYASVLHQVNGLVAKDKLLPYQHSGRVFASFDLHSC